MTSTLVYTILHETAPDLLAGKGAPAELIVRRSGMNVPENALTGSRLYVLSVVRGQATLSLAAEVDAAFEIEEGQFAGDIMLELRSERTIQTTSLANSSRWAIDSQSVKIGELDYCSDSLGRIFIQLLQSGWITRTAVPQPVSTKRLWSGPLSYSRARSLVAEVLRTSSLDSLERHYTHRNLSPIGSQAFRLVELADPTQAERLIGLLADVDPLADSLSPAFEIVPSSRTVDTSLVPIDPSTIVARRFLQTAKDVDQSQRLARLERAESIHQRAVRRLAQGVVACGLTARASSSIDLAIELPAMLTLLEVKSVTAGNIESQLMTAVGQLLFYEAEVSQVHPGERIRGHIVLAGETPFAIPDSCTRLASRAKVGIHYVEVPLGDESPLTDLVRTIL